MKLDHTIKNTHPTFTIGEHKSARRYKTGEAEIDPRMMAAMREAIKAEMGGQVKELTKAIEHSGSANSDLAAGLLIRDSQAKDGTLVNYDNPNNNRVPWGATWASGQNGYYSAGQMPGMTTPFREVYIARPVAAGNTTAAGGANWYQAKVPIESCPPGTVFTTGDGTTEYIDENGVARVIPVQHLGAAGEPIDMGQINYKLLPGHLDRFYRRTEPGLTDPERKIKVDALLKEYGAHLAISETPISFPWMRMMGNGLGKPEPFQPNFYAIRYKKDAFFHYYNEDGDIIKINEKGEYDPNGEDHFGFVRTNRKFIRDLVDEKDASGKPTGRQVLKFRREGEDLAGEKIKKNGKPAGVDGFLATDGFEYENADGTGKPVMKFYMAGINLYDEPRIMKDANGNEVLVEITDKKAQPQVELEGLMGRDGKIVDPKRMFLDNAHPLFGFKKESISMENLRRVWSFKRDLLLDTTKPLDQQTEQYKKMPEELKAFFSFPDKVRYSHSQFKDPVIEVNKGGKKVKYRIVQERDFDAIRKYDPMHRGTPPAQFYAYELDEKGDPIPQVKLPEIGMLSDVKNQPGDPLYKDSMYQHFTGNYQPTLDGKQSDGSSHLGRGMYWHGRVIDRNRARHMLTYLDDIKTKDHSAGATLANWFFDLGYEDKNDFLPNSRFAAVRFAKQQVYQKMREASAHDLRAGSDGAHTDNQVTIWYEYGLSRCISDFVNGTNRAIQGAKEATTAGLLCSGLAGAGCLALGMTAIPAAGVFIGAFAVSGYFWNSAIYQHSRRRKDTVTVEELESHADTSLIYGQYGEKTNSREVLLQDRKKTMSLYNTIGIQNDVYVALRGLFGAMYLWNGAYMGLDKIQEKAGKYAISAAAVTTSSIVVAGAGLSSVAYLSTTLGVAASVVTTTTLALTGVGAIAALGLGGMAGLGYAYRYMSREGKDFGEAMKDEFTILKPKYYRWKALESESIAKHKDTFQRVGFAKRTKETRYTLPVAGHGVGE